MRYTVCSHRSVYGEGIPQSEADAISRAVAGALRRRFRGLQIDVRRCRRDPGRGDPRVEAWLERKWEAVAATDRTGQTYTPERLVKWWNRQR